VNNRFYTGTSFSNTTLSWTSLIRQRRHLPTHGGWWGVADAVVHALKLPRAITRPVCDHYEIAAGIPKSDLIEMGYKGVAPWWLR